MPREYHLIHMSVSRLAFVVPPLFVAAPHRLAPSCLRTAMLPYCQPAWPKAWPSGILQLKTRAGRREASTSSALAVPPSRTRSAASEGPSPARSKKRPWCRRSYARYAALRATLPADCALGAAIRPARQQTRIPAKASSTRAEHSNSTLIPARPRTRHAGFGFEFKYEELPHTRAAATKPPHPAPPCACGGSAAGEIPRGSSRTAALRSQTGKKIKRRKNTKITKWKQRCATTHANMGK